MIIIFKFEEKYGMILEKISSTNRNTHTQNEYQNALNKM